MATIVEYTDRKTPRNRYPRSIISPAHSGPCCFSSMEEMEGAAQEGRWLVQYKRCRRCGFTVRVPLRHLPDTKLVAELQQILATSFKRNIPAY
jgi:hypothetical protein